MNEFDDKVRAALRAGRKIEIGGHEIESVRGLMTEVFQFRSKFLAVVSIAKIATAHGMMIAAGIFTFLAEDDRSRMLWGFGCLFCLMSLGILWNFHWMLLNRNALLRELKRLELQMADSARIGGA